VVGGAAGLQLFPYAPENGVVADTVVAVLHLCACICFGSLDLTVCRGLSLFGPKGFMIPALFFQRGFGT
jgi:hypothetical protein